MPRPALILIETPPLALYLHIPWCVRKCPYCDFNSHPVRETLDERAYVDALLRDLAYEAGAVPGREVESVFIGGGTPSLFSGEAIDALLRGVRNQVVLASDVEITLEANPGTAEAGRFAAYREAGVNRLSLGVQSLDAAKLKALGRIHGPDEARAAVAMARAAGFDNLNLDLMFGLPDQRVEQALADLERAIDLGPEHLSWYQLTLEPHTAFAAAPPSLPDEDRLWQMQQAGSDRLRRAGYVQYEVSAHARAGHRCRHNLNYWRFGDYLGIGAGAHGKVSGPGGVERRWKRRRPDSYLKEVVGGGGLAGRRILSEHDRQAEFMLNALRLTNGFSPSLFEHRTGLSLKRIGPVLEEAVQKGLIESSWRDRVVPSVKGRLFLDDLVSLFL